VTGLAPYDPDLARSRRDACERIAQQAGELLRSRFGTPGQVRRKGTTQLAYDIVTDVDVLAEQLVLAGIASVAPDAVVLAEEGGLTTPAGARVELAPADADELWIVDPLDGTINFAHDIPHFAVSVACWRRGRPVAGAIVDPMVGETFSVELAGPDGDVAYHQGQPVLAPDPGSAGDALVYIGSSVRRLPELISRFRGCRQLASACLALAWTGVGRTGAYVQLGGLNPWDWAVGAPFVQAAGGVMSTPDGGAWQPPLVGTTGLMAAAPSVHEQIAPILAAATRTASP
jgi:myo-inositol-1(or 4)-monophosphatase